MRIGTQSRPRKPPSCWTRADQEACIRGTATPELLDSYLANVRDFPTWQQSADLKWDQAVKRDELLKRGLQV